MDYKIKVYSIYETGARRDRVGVALQEDAISPRHDHESDDDRVFIVADGMGGRNAGEIASTTVCDTISRRLAAARVIDKDTVDAAVTAAYDALDALAPQVGESKMGSTLALLALVPDGYLTAHMGDSRVYHIRPGRTMDQTSIVNVTLDHTLVNYMVKKGEMTRAEAATSPKRNVITRALQPGMERRCHADVYVSTDVQSGDYFLVCSDGLLENITDDNLRAVFSTDGGNDRNKVALLRQASVNNSDNVSALIVHVLEVGALKDPATAPAGATRPFERPVTPRTVATRTDPADRPQRTVRRQRAQTPSPQPETQPMNDNTPRPARKAKGAANEIVERYGKGDGPAFFIKVLVGLMALMALVMFIYYAFVRTDETLQTAGTAVEATVPPEESSYGYEITEQDVRNAAQPVAPDFDTTPVEDEVPEVIDNQVVSEQTPAPPAGQADDEPMLME